MIYGSQNILILDTRQRLKEPFVSSRLRKMHSNGPIATGGVPCDGKWSFLFVDAWNGSIEDALALQKTLHGKPDGLAMSIRFYAHTETPPKDILCTGSGSLTQLDVWSEGSVPVVQCEADGSNGLVLGEVIDLTLNTLKAKFTECQARLRSLAHRQTTAPGVVEQLAEKIEFVEYYLSETSDPSPEQIRMLMERLD